MRLGDLIIHDEELAGTHVALIAFTRSGHRGLRPNLSCNAGGDPIPQAYGDRVVVAARTNEATEAYNAGNFQSALEMFEDAQIMSGGEQLRVLTGVYLSSAKLDRQEPAAEAFGKVVDFGLQSGSLATKFLFRTGTTQFVAGQISRPYQMWLRQIAERTAASNRCLEVIGHTSATARVSSTSGCLCCVRRRYAAG